MYILKTTGVLNFNWQHLLFNKTKSLQTLSNLLFFVRLRDIKSACHIHKFVMSGFVLSSILVFIKDLLKTLPETEK